MRLITQRVQELQHESAVWIWVFLSSSQFHVIFITGFTTNEPRQIQHLVAWNHEKQNKTDHFNWKGGLCHQTWLSYRRKYTWPALGALNESHLAVKWEVFCNQYCNPTPGGDINVSSVALFCPNLPQGRKMLRPLLYISGLATLTYCADLGRFHTD